MITTDHMNLARALVEDDPKGAFEAIRADLKEQLRKRGILEHHIIGIDLALQISFRLGVKAGEEKQQ
jgi:hypothetical protein